MSQAAPTAAATRPPRRWGWLLLLAFVACGSLWAVNRGRRAAHLARLRDCLTICTTLHDATGADWGRLPTEDRRTVCQALLVCPGLDWHDSLNNAPVTLTLLWVAREDPVATRRALALRRLGEMAISTPAPPTADPSSDLLSRVARALRSAQADPEAEVRAAALAAWVRFRPVARAYRLEDPSSGWSVPSEASR